MLSKRYIPMIDKIFFIILIPTLLMLGAATVLASFDKVALFIIIPVDVLSIYCMIAPLFGYVELRESTVFIKFGLVVKREIEYGRIRGITKERKFYADSMIALKNSLEHVNIKYDRFDVYSVSVVNNDELIAELEKRI